MTADPDLTHLSHESPTDSTEATPGTRACIVLFGEESDFGADESFLRVFGYEDPSEIRTTPFSTFVHPDDRERVRSILERRRRGEAVPDHYEFKGLRKNGETILVEASTAALEYGGATLSVLHLKDVTKRRYWEKELRRSEEKYRTLFENSMDAIYVSRRDGRVIDVNRAFLDLFGYARDEALALNAREAIQGRDRHRFREAMRQKGFLRDFGLILTKKDGTEMDCLLTVNPMREEGGKICAFQGIVRDITAFKKAQEDVRHMAYHDSLTGLPNRMLFSDRLNMAIINATRNRQHIAVMMLDLDRFKDVNDTFGHDTGDKLLKAVSARLQETVRKSDTVARMGGDEFLLVLPEMSEVDDSLVVSEKIMQAFRTAFPAGERQLSVTCSVGIAIYPDHASEAEALIRCADAAMYEVKREGRNSYRLGRIEVDENRSRLHRIETRERE